MTHRIMVKKASGEMEAYSEQKLYRSLEKSGADKTVIDAVVAHISNEVRKGQTKSTKEISARAFTMLRSQQRSVAARYSLKRALFALGPSGFPFERYAARLFDAMGYTTKVGVTLEGKCVKHEVDIVLSKGTSRGFAECKFHNEQGIRSDIKTALYVKARFDDLKQRTFAYGNVERPLDEGWLVTNTRFTDDAMAFAKCAGIKLMGWDVGALGESIERLIDTRGLHPITCLTTLSASQKSELLTKNIVLCQDLFSGKALTKVSGLSLEKQQRVIKEAKELCKHPA